MILVGPGTGIAPFRGFLEERAAQQAAGEAVRPVQLYYGCRHPAHDWLYRDDVARWEEQGVAEVHAAYSVVDGAPCFVQDLLWQRQADVWAQLNAGAVFYVCGDGRHMAPAVRQTLIRIAAETAKRAKIAFLMLPGVGTKDDIRAAQDNGGQICRIATHCTEADTSIQHFGLARELGLETVGFLMMSHTQTPEVLAKQARIMVDAGCQCVYVVDSAGALIMEQTSDRVAAVVAEIGDTADVGFHGHENLALGVANTVAAARAGATQIDGSVRRFGAGAGNTPLEAFIGVCDKLGWRTGVDFLQIVDASEDVIKPAMPEECELNRMTLMMGYAGVYSSFLKHAGNAADRYGVSGAKILLEAGRRKLIGGQEDQLIDIALMLKAEQDKAAANA